MPDALTESFCERCGTRYEFAEPEPLTPMRKTRGLISGLKNYILSQDSLSDAVGDAMRSQEEVLAAKQLEAFHSTFNFCIDCRQYTCTSCWNDDEGRCQSCKPLPQVEGLARQFEATMGQVQPDFALDMSWPTSDLQEPLPSPTLLLPEPEIEPMPLLAEVEPAPSAEPEAEPEPIAAERWAELMPTLAEVDPIPAEPMVIEPEPEPEPVAAVVEPEPIVLEPEPEPEPVAAEVEPEPEPEPVAPEPIPLRPVRPIADTFLHYPRPVPSDERVAASAAEDREALAARAAQLDMLGLGDPGQGPVAPGRPVLLPYRSSGAAAPAFDRLAAASVAAGHGFWDASAREVAEAVSQIGVRSCAQCELSLSATARFCRRCGTPQAQSA